MAKMTASESAGMFFRMEQDNRQYESHKLETQYQLMRNAKTAFDLKKAANAPSEREKFEKDRELNLFKHTIGAYNEMMTKEMSPAARDVMKGNLLNFISAYPEEFHKAAGPALSYSPIDKVRQGMEDFRRINPPPRDPRIGGPFMGLKAADNWTEPDGQQMASYKFAKAEYDMMEKGFRRKLSGAEKMSAEESQLPMMMQDDEDKDRFWYKDRKTNQIGYINMKNLPQGEVEKAIAEYGQSYGDIMKFGGPYISKPAEYMVGADRYRMTHRRSWVNGGIQTQVVKTMDGQEKAGAVNENLASAVVHLNSDKVQMDKIIDPEVRSIIGKIKGIEEDYEDDPKYAQSRMKEYNKTLASTYGHIVVPFDEQVKKSFLGFDTGYKKVGRYALVSVNSGGMYQVVNPTTGQSAIGELWWSDEMNMPVDTKGKPVPSGKGVKPNPDGPPPVIEADIDLPKNQKQNDKQTTKVRLPIPAGQIKTGRDSSRAQLESLYENAKNAGTVEEVDFALRSIKILKGLLGAADKKRLIWVEKQMAMQRKRLEDSGKTLTRERILR